MISYPNAKINLGLNLIEKRSDGYHEIESVFYPVNWKDILEIVPSGQGSGVADFTSSGIEIPGDANGNLCVRAYQILNEAFSLPSVKIHLHKVIPIGAGLGGGSADASFTLRTLNDLFDLGQTTTQLEEFAGRLGSDCPFFIENQPKYVTGRGEIMEPFSVDLSAYKIVLVNPGIHIGTAQAYENVELGMPTHDLRKVLASAPETWRNYVANGFERSVFPKHEAIQKIKTSLYDMGALYASMTGSGSTVFGLFKGEVPDLSLFEGMNVKLS